MAFIPSLADPRDPELATQLDHEIQLFRSQLFAESTKATYTTHRNTYLRFCLYMGYTPGPSTSDAPSSIRCILGEISQTSIYFQLP